MILFVFKIILAFYGKPFDSEKKAEKMFWQSGVSSAFRAASRREIRIALERASAILRGQKYVERNEEKSAGLSLGGPKETEKRFGRNGQRMKDEI